MMDSKTMKKENRTLCLTDFIFSWSIADIMNESLYKDKIDRIPDTFSSPKHYLSSFITPLLEETHADLRSNLTAIRSSPAREIHRIKKTDQRLLYELHLKTQGEKYEPQFGDLVALTDLKPKCITDLNRPKAPYTLALVERSSHEASPEIYITSSKPILFDEGEMRNKLFVVYLTNLNTNLRIWNALSSGEGGNTNIITSVLRVDPNIDEECGVCNCSFKNAKSSEIITSFALDDSQKAAVSNCVSLTKCVHRSSVKLIWGPPGTGKTKTISSLAFTLLGLKCKALICAPTNVAVLGVAKRLVNILASKLERDKYGLGDVVLFGNAQRMKIHEHEDLHDVFLDHSVSELARVLSPVTGWKAVVNEIIAFLEKTDDHYLRYVEQHEGKEGERSELLTFDEFFANTFVSLRNKLVSLVTSLCKNMPTSVLTSIVVEKMKIASRMLSELEVYSLDKLKRSEEIRYAQEFHRRKIMCLEIMNSLSGIYSIPEMPNDDSIESFCLRNAWLIFSTVSSSSKLHVVNIEMKPVELVIIDEAAQVKECESSIPLQLPGIHHAVLVGDEKQLPAMVISKICQKARFGRSLFERLVKLGHEKHLLNVQYRMHPSISLFPNKEFYQNRITNGSNITSPHYKNIEN